MSSTPKEEDLFHAAIEINDTAARSEFLADACGADVALRTAVEELLALHDTAGEFLETPVVPVSPAELNEGAGATVGNYRLVERIGEGGFGEVYRAEQHAPVQRDVALKIIRLGMDTKEIVRRFEAERQALALMSHPNIATVLDAGVTPRGRPYFVMELVAGRPIDEFCDAERLDVRQRLKLFIIVCRAVQHAHQQGVVHRDLKPSNVLVTRDDSDSPGVPKVIDFGVAKALKQPRDDGTTHTAVHQLIGTPQYMSPEQIDGAGDIDTRADIYALGGLLYKLLTGVTPLESQCNQESSLDEICHAIRDVDPPSPSVRLAQLVAWVSDPSQSGSNSLGSETQATVAARRHTQPAALVRMLRGDLDWIVMKALEKDRSRRYESASELARDIERHLNGEPVTAGPPSRWYRASKFIRRNRIAVTAATLVAIASVGGGVLATAGFVHAEHERQRAERQQRRAELLRDQAELARERAEDAGHQAELARQAAERQRHKAENETEKAQRVAALLEQLLGSSHPEHGHAADYTVRQLLDDFADSLGGQLDGQPEIEAALRRTIGRSYLRIGQLSRAGPQLERALELRRRALGDANTLTAQSRVDYAMYLVMVPRLDEAEQMAHAAIDTLRKSPANGDLAWAHHVLAVVRFEYGDLSEADRLRREAWTLAERALGRDHPDAIILQSRAAGAMMRSNRESAEQLARDALERLRTIRPAEHADVAQLETNLAWVLFSRSKLDEAEQLVRQAITTLRKTLGPDSGPEAFALSGLAEVLVKQNRYAEAESAARDAVGIAGQATMEQATLRARAFRVLAMVLQGTKPAESADAWAKAIEVRRQITGDGPEVALLLRRRAAVLQQLGRFDDAVECHRAALAIARERRDAPMALTMSHVQLAEVLREAGRAAEAEITLREALASGRESQDQPFVRFALVETLIDLNKLADSDAEVRGLERLYGSDSRPIFRAMTQAARGKLLVAQGDFAAAEKLLLESLGQLRWQQHPQARLHVANVLGQCLIQTSRFAEAEQHLLRIERLTPRYNVRPDDVRRLLKLLVNLYTAWDKPNEADRWRQRLQQTPVATDEP